MNDSRKDAKHVLSEVEGRAKTKLQIPNSKSEIRNNSK